MTVSKTIIKAILAFVTGYAIGFIIRDPYMAIPLGLLAGFLISIGVDVVYDQY